MAEGKPAEAKKVEVDLKSVPGSVDMMNYATEAGFEEYLFDWEEFKIMARATFKTQFGGKPPTREQFRAIKKQGFMPGHDSPEALIKTMDEAGFDYVCICDVKMWSYYFHHQLIMDYGIEVINKLVKGGKGRLIGGASYNPFRIDQSLRDIEKGVKEYGFKYVYMHPITFGLTFSDAKLYPLYAKCSELGIPVGMQVGHSAEPLPSWVGHPMEVDKVAIDFPNLKINMSHTGYPWVDEWCSVIFRQPNVYGDISAYNPSNLTQDIVSFFNSSRGREKVMFGSNSYGLKLTKAQFLDLPIKDETKKRVLGQNAKEFLGLK
jgi:predicted TIM-barrel fold metal-dependent hydrolase